MDDIFVYLVDMPHKARAVSVPCGDCDYTVYLNSNLTFEMREEAYRHELKHIRNNDHDARGDVDAIELERNA